jgi:chromosome segregation ATPase
MTARNLQASARALPQVRLEVRQGSGRSVTYTLDHVDFLIGSVAGCDWRVPGADLPPVLCLIARRPDGAYLRKLAPTQVLLVNGQSTTGAALQDGDRITLGVDDIFVRIEHAAAAAADDEAAPLAAAKTELHKQGQALRDQVRRFQQDRETQAQEQQRLDEALRQRQHKLEERERALQQGEAAAATSVTARAADAAELERQRQELAGQRQELSELRRELHERYQERRDRLAGLQEAVTRAARNVQEQKRRLSSDLKDFAQRQAELQRDTEAAERRRLDEQRRVLAESQAQLRNELAAKVADLKSREEKLAVERDDLEAKLKRYQADVLRLDRRQGELEQREQDLTTRTATLEQDLGRLRIDSAELASQADQLEASQSAWEKEELRLVQAKQDHEANAAQLNQRAAMLEGQQATLAALRTRLERMREDVRRQEQQLDERRARQETAETELEKQQQALSKLKAEVDNDQKARALERQQLSERSAVLEAAVHQLGKARAQLETHETQLRERSEDLARRESAFAEQQALLEGRLQQIAEAQERLNLERQTLRERTLALTEGEQARAALQEQLRKRSEELADRHKALEEQTRAQEAAAENLAAERLKLEQIHQDALAQVEDRRRELEARAEKLDQRHTELAQVERKAAEQAAQLQELARTVAAQQEALACQQQENQKAWRERQEADAQSKVELEALRQDARRAVQLLPDAELRAGSVLDRVALAREQLKGHVATVHAFMRQCQEELETQQARLQGDVDLLERQEQELRRGQDEHRLALTSFRQQLIDWQGQINTLKRQLGRGETKLERRRAEMDEQVRELDVAAQRLAGKAEELDVQHRAVAEQRAEMDRHLLDLRAWYRQKLRQLAGIPVEAETTDASRRVRGTHQAAAGEDAAAEQDVALDETGDDAIVPTQRDILSITEPLDPGDEKLGATLQTLGLVDKETLTALFIDARRQRRSLRQALLASGVITLYQLALIEAGNLSGLMMGPVRVIDRVRTTPHETVYRVFDPRRGQEALLRHLAESDTRDVARADEFRRRLAGAALVDPHLAAPYEVIEVDGRPAALQEWLTGLPAGDWPPLAAAPGVCYRLLTQAALGLATAHKAGLVHGHLDDGALMLTAAGIVKICGLGEPPWLVGKPVFELTPRDDLRALGRIASSWCLPSGVRKGAKTKPLPEPLLTILHRLATELDAGYSSAAELLEDLDHVGADIPPNAEAWDRLLRYVREHETPEAVLRQTA